MKTVSTLHLRHLNSIQTSNNYRSTCMCFLLFFFLFVKKENVKVLNNLRTASFIKKLLWSWQKGVCDYLPGHDLSWQLLAWVKSAVQFSPPLAGTGLLHSRLLDLVPVPHVLLHVAHADHKPNPPSTINKTKRGQTNRWLVLKRRVELGWIQQYNVQFLCPLASPVWMGIYEKEFALKYS